MKFSHNTQTKKYQIFIRIKEGTKLRCLYMTYSGNGIDTKNSCIWPHTLIKSFLHTWKWKWKWSHVWLCDPTDCSLPGSSVHGTFQAKILYRFICSMAFGILVPWPGIKPTSPSLQRGFLILGPPRKSQHFLSLWTWRAKLSHAA